MANYTTQSIGHGGLPALVMSTPVNGDTMTPGPGVALLVVSGASGAPVLGLPMPAYDSQTVGPRSITMAASNNYLIPVPSAVYGSSAITLSWTGTLTTVTVAAVVITTT